MEEPGFSRNVCSACKKPGRWRHEVGIGLCAKCGFRDNDYLQFKRRFGVVSQEHDELFEEQREAKREEITALLGAPCRRLYVISLQLILRSQIAWLIRSEGYIPELNTVARDLWDLRIRGIDLSILTARVADSPNANNLDAASDAGLRLVDDSGSASESTPRHFGPNVLPRLVDTLGICYLACVLLRVPCRLGQLFQWANEGLIPYKHAYETLPAALREHMPPAYSKVLGITTSSTTNGDDLLESVKRLASLYDREYGLEFPAVNLVPILVCLATELAIPVETISITVALLRTSGTTLSFSVFRSRVRLINHPEVALFAMIITAAKLFMPFQATSRVLGDAPAMRLPKMNWKIWGEMVPSSTNTEAAAARNKRYDNVTVQAVVAMTAEELDNYLEYVSTYKMYSSEDLDLIANFFPLASSLSRPSQTRVLRSTRIENTTDRMRYTQHMALTYNDHGCSDNSHVRAGEPILESYQEAHDVPEHAVKLYKRAADLTGLTISQMVEAVYNNEIALFQFQQRRLKSDKKGRAKRPSRNKGVGNLDGLGLLVP